MCSLRLRSASLALAEENTWRTVLYTVRESQREGTVQCTVVRKKIFMTVYTGWDKANSDSSYGFIPILVELLYVTNVMSTYPSSKRMFLFPSH